MYVYMCACIYNEAILYKIKVFISYSVYHLSIYIQKFIIINFYLYYHTFNVTGMFKRTVE